MKRNEEFLSYYLQTTADGSPITDELLTNIPDMYFEILLHVAHVVLRFCDVKDFKLVPLILERRRNWKQKSE